MCPRRQYGERLLLKQQLINTQSHNVITFIKHNNVQINWITYYIEFILQLKIQLNYYAIISIL